MAISDKLQEVYDNVSLVYAAGLSNGRAENWLYYATCLNNVFGGSIFPTNSRITLQIKQAPTKSDYMFNNCRNVSYIKLIGDEPQTNTLDMTSAFAIAANATTLARIETIDLSQYCGGESLKLKSPGTAVPSSINSNFAAYQSRLKYIYGMLDLTMLTNTGNMFLKCSELIEVRFVANTIRYMIKFNDCTKLSKETLTSIVNGLADDVTGKGVVLSLTAINSAFTTDEWNALIATKPNWAFTYA